MADVNVSQGWMAVIYASSGAAALKAIDWWLGRGKQRFDEGAAIRKEMNEREAGVRSALQSHRDALASLEMELRGELRLQEIKVDEERDARYKEREMHQTATAEWQQKLFDMQTTHQKAIADLQAFHYKELSDLRAQHQLEMEALRQQHQLEMKELQDQMGVLSERVNSNTEAIERKH